MTKLVLPIIIYDDPHFEDEAVVFTEWKCSVYTPARTSGTPDDTYPEEGGEVEFVRAWVTMPDSSRNFIEYDLIKVHIEEQLPDYEVYAEAYERLLRDLTPDDMYEDDY